MILPEEIPSVVSRLSQGQSPSKIPEADTAAEEHARYPSPHPNTLCPDQATTGTQQTTRWVVCAIRQGRRRRWRRHHFWAEPEQYRRTCYPDK